MAITTSLKTGFLLLVLAGLLVAGTAAHAAPRVSPYGPGETLAPDCLPGEANCSVHVSTSDIAEGANAYYSDARVLSYLDSLDASRFFSTTSAEYLLSQGGSASFSNASITNATTTNLFASNLTLGTLTGFLRATAGVVATALVNLASDVTGILPIANGGTGNPAGGTTNGVEYYDGLKLTNGSGFVFDGSHVGIGTTTPAFPFVLSGANSSTTYLDPSIGVPVVPQALLSTSYSAPGTTNFANLFVDTTERYTTAQAGGTNYGIYDSVTIPASATVAQPSIAALGVFANHRGSAPMSTLYGANLIARSSGSATIASMNGFLGSVQIAGGTGATSTNASGVTGIVAVTSPYSRITNAQALSASLTLGNANASFTNGYGLKINDLINTGSITSTYGVYVGDITAGTQTNRPYSFYAFDASAYNYFAGNTGIGTSSPATALEVGGDVTIDAILNCNGLTQAVVTDANGKLQCGALTPSDKRLKTNIEPLDAASGLSLIEKLRPVSYDWKDPRVYGNSPQLQYGFIAQEEREVAPNLVATTAPTALTPGETYVFNYFGLIAPIVKAIQELDARIVAFGESFSSAVATFGAVTTRDITVEQALCIGSTCVTEDDLKAILSNNRMQAPAPPPPPAEESAPDTASPEEESADTPKDSADIPVP
ncbi:MAG: tail fiber domain-containing protein [bacterium]